MNQNNICYGIVVQDITTDKRILLLVDRKCFLEFKGKSLRMSTYDIFDSLSRSYLGQIITEDINKSFVIVERKHFIKKSVKQIKKHKRYKNLPQWNTN